MAHRIYLYNVDAKTKKEYPHYLGEWKYVIPDLLLPLFSGNPESKGKMMYFDKEEGIARLRLFYNLLADHYQLHYRKAYYEPVNTMFGFLEDLPYDTFVMDAEDVFYMSGEDHAEQAKGWILEIIQKNKLFDKAVSEQNLDVLNEIIQAAGYSSFLEMLQDSWVNYGLGYWNEDAYKNAPEIFEENGLFGLKDHKGEILSEPFFDDFFDFSEGFAVVQKDGFFGYIQENGKLLIECKYQDGYDAFLLDNTLYGIVCHDNSFGLIHIHTEEWAIPNEYESLELLYNGLFNARKDDNFYLLDKESRQVVDGFSETPFEFDYNGLIFRKQKGTSKRCYYSLTGVYLGDHPENSLHIISGGYYWVKPNKFQQKISIISPDGSLLDTNIDKIIVLDDYDTVAYKKAKDWYIYDLQHSCFRLDAVDIEQLHIDGFSRFVYNVFIISVQGETGLYHAVENRWLVPLSKDHLKIEHCNQEVFRIITPEGTYYYDQKTDSNSETYDCIIEGIEYETQLICLFRGESMFALDHNRRLHEISSEEMGRLYEKRYNLRGKDQQYFLDYYRGWTKRMGSGYEAYFDDTTLFHQANELKNEGDLKEAVRLYTIGAERGSAEMMTELGLIYTDAEHPEFCNLSAGISYLEQAAEKDYAAAWNNIGYLYQQGIGYSKNIVKAIEAYEKAAALGDGQAMSNLGHLYFYGDETEQNYDLALDFYKKAEKKYFFNEENISEIYYQRQDYANLQRYLKKDVGNTYSHIYYGIMYDHGFGVKQNIKKAIRHYEKALGYLTYTYALERLLHYYKEDPAFADPEKYSQWISYAENNDMKVN
ncbi:tetratricopeptide repeat protein [Chryseobacterium gossypii]|uniref:tetratricopeptide repeat protein n=1 Tax=Chryseobacterium gossypii TaxID=3231602 RepID=UPI00352602B4